MSDSNKQTVQLECTDTSCQVNTNSAKDVKIELFFRQYVRLWTGTLRDPRDVLSDLSRLYGSNISRKSRRFSLPVSADTADVLTAKGCLVSEKNNNKLALISETVFTIARSLQESSLEECEELFSSIKRNFPDTFVTIRMTLVETLDRKAL